jgi:hypothetical protein
LSKADSSVESHLEFLIDPQSGEHKSISDRIFDCDKGLR